MKRKAEQVKVVVTVTLDGEILYLAEVSSAKDPEKAEVSSIVSPYANLVRIAELFAKLAEGERENYYMGRVRTLSKEAREAIEKSLRDEDDVDSLPF